MAQVLWVIHKTLDGRVLGDSVSTANCISVSDFRKTLRNYPDLDIPPNIPIALYQADEETEIDGRVPLASLVDEKLLIVKTVPVQKLWIQHKTTPDLGKIYLDLIAIGNCTCVTELLEALYDRPLLGIPKNTRLTLYQADGTTEIDVASSPSLLVKKNTSKQPLVVVSVAVTPIASFVLTRIPFYRDIYKADEHDSWLLFKHTIPYLDLTAKEPDATNEPDASKVPDASTVPDAADRKSTRLNSSHDLASRMPSSA